MEKKNSTTFHTASTNQEEGIPHNENSEYPDSMTESSTDSQNSYSDETDYKPEIYKYKYEEVDKN